MYVLENETLTTRINPKGAELTSLKDKNGCEYIWQADPQWWPQHAPLLFPIVGALRDDRYLWEEKEFQLPIHGFGSTLNYACKQASGTAITLEASSDKNTLITYPFSWSLNVHFELNANCITSTYEVTNTGPGVMPFAIGGHPGFSLNWAKNDLKTDYSLTFQNTRQLVSHRLNEERLLTTETFTIPCKNGKLPYHDDLIRDHALILKDIPSKSVTLSSCTQPQKLELTFHDFPHLGIWSIPHAPFICIEPWFSHVDPSDHDGRLESKPGLVHLQPGKSHTSSFSIKIHLPV